MAPVRGVQGNRRHPFFRDEGSEPGGGGLRKGLRAEARPPSNARGWPRPQGAGPPLGWCDSSQAALPGPTPDPWLAAGCEGRSLVEPFHVLSPLASPQPARRASPLAPYPHGRGKARMPTVGWAGTGPHLLPRP